MESLGFSRGEEARIKGGGRESGVLKGGGIAGFGRWAEKRDFELGRESKFREVVLIREYRRGQRA